MIVYTAGDELPAAELTVLEDDGTVIDLSAGYTFEVKVAPIGSTTASFTKTTGVTGAATAPNATVTWATSAELSTLTAGLYTLQFRATRTSDSRNLTVHVPLEIRAQIA